MSQYTVRKRYVLKGHDAWELGYRLEALRQIICGRNGIIVGVEWGPPTATGLLTASIQYRLPLTRAGTESHAL